MFPFLDLASALSGACADLVKFKSNKKFSKEAWDMGEYYCRMIACTTKSPGKKSISFNFVLVIPAFINSNSNVPRRQLGVEGEFSKMALIQFAIRLRNPVVVNVVLSLLTRIHNVLRDEPNLELYFMYLQLWPQNVLK